MANGEGRQVFNDKVFALLSYFPFLCIIPLLLKKQDPFVLAHGKQGLVLFIAEIGVFILSIVFPWFLKVGMFILLAVSFWGMLAVLNGKIIQIPIVSKLADKISL